MSEGLAYFLSCSRLKVAMSSETGTRDGVHQPHVSGAEGTNPRSSEIEAALRLQRAWKKFRKRPISAAPPSRGPGEIFSMSMPMRRVDFGLYEFPAFALLSSRVLLVSSVKKSSLAAYFGLQWGDMLMQLQGRSAADWTWRDLRALRHGDGAAWSCWSFARGSREDREEMAAVRLQSLWRGHCVRSCRGSYGAQMVSPEAKMPVEGATTYNLPDETQPMIVSTSELQHLCLQELPAFSHWLSRLYVVYQVRPLGALAVRWGDVLRCVEGREASKLRALELDGLLRKASSVELELSFSAGSREEREVVAALRIQAAYGRWQASKRTPRDISMLRRIDWSWWSVCGALRTRRGVSECGRPCAEVEVILASRLGDVM
eukprot:s3347_g8.t1